MNQHPRADQMFPTLTSAQRNEAARFASGPVRSYGPGEWLFKTGEEGAPAFLVIGGCVEVVRRDHDGVEQPVASHGPGALTGEVGQLAGRPALAGGRAGPQGCEAAPFDAPHLRALVVGSAEIGEIVMRALILRRAALISDGVGAVILGARADPTTVRLQGFLSRNGYPFTLLDPGADDGSATLVERLGLAEADLPVMLCPSGTLLKRPSDIEVGVCLGLTLNLSAGRLYDVAVVGAGPAGLATAVYAASEGLSVVVLDARAFGGQAGASARIENYLGFPTGITGQALMGRAFSQAQKFGAEIAVPVEVTRLHCGGPNRAHDEPLRLELGNGNVIPARAVVIASGARYRRPDIQNLSDFEGAGVSYWASPVEAQLCAGEEVALVGAGNSAGQAVVFLAGRVKRLHLVVRGDGLEASMSRYLIERIAALPNVELHTRSEVVSLDGEAGVALAEVGFRDRQTGATDTYALKHLFLFIGAEPKSRSRINLSVDTGVAALA